MFHLFGALAQVERDLIRERTNAGLKLQRHAAAKAGRKPVFTPAERSSIEKAGAPVMQKSQVLHHAENGGNPGCKRSR